MIGTVLRGDIKRAEAKRDIKGCTLLVTLMIVSRPGYGQPSTAVQDMMLTHMLLVANWSVQNDTKKLENH